MPKISKKHIVIKTAKIDKAFDVEMFYNKDYLFYIKLPSEFMNVIETVDDDNKKINHVRALLTKGYPRTIDSYIATGASEAEAENAFIQFIKMVLSLSLIERKVIFIKCNNIFNNHYYGNNANREARLRDEVGGNFSVLYGIETKSSAEAVAKYYEVDDDGHKREVHMGYNKDKYVVVDDTPQMRSTLETLHGAISALFYKLEQICTAENIHKLTSINQLMHGNN